MMHVWIDDVPWPGAESTRTKEELWTALNAFLAPLGKVPHLMVLDGEPLEAEAFLQVAGGQELRVTSRPVRDLVRESLDQAVGYFSELRKGAANIADLLEEEKMQEALPLLSQLSEGTEWVLQVLARSQSLLALPDQELGDGGMGQVREHLLSVLRGMTASMEGEKFFDLAFRLREELVPTLDHLRGYVEALRELAENVQ